MIQIVAHYNIYLRVMSFARKIIFLSNLVCNDRSCLMKIRVPKSWVVTAV